MTHRTMVGKAVAVLLVSMSAAALEAADNNTFVIGFERFARHGEMSEVDAGALLASELNCTACHASDAEWIDAKGAPDLRGVGLRLNRLELAYCLLVQLVGLRYFASRQCGLGRTIKKIAVSELKSWVVWRLG